LRLVDLLLTSVLGVLELLASEIALPLRLDGTKLDDGELFDGLLHLLGRRRRFEPVRLRLLSELLAEVGDFGGTVVESLPENRLLRARFAVVAAILDESARSEG
jgi:hypothetical protein